MYTLYSMKVTDGPKKRFCHGSTDNLDEAKHAAIAAPWRRPTPM